MGSGNIILLNGTSSSGKTTIARALQQSMSEPYYLQGMDMLQAGFPPGVIHYVDENDPNPAEGWDIAIKDGRLVEVLPGPGAIRFLSGMYRSFAAFASAGNHLIIDDVIYHREILQAAVRELHDANVLFVGIFLPLAVAEQRERDRAAHDPRLLGGASTFFQDVHVHGTYDLVVDNTIASAQQSAQIIREAVESNHPRSALQDLWRVMQEQ